MQKLEVQLEDDLTGGPADETIVFGVDGRDFEIDLNAKHAARFRKQLATFVDRARPMRAHQLRASARTSASRERSRAIRVWAEEQGLKVADHGRLPLNVIQEYERVQSEAQIGHGLSRRSVRRRA